MLVTLEVLRVKLSITHVPLHCLLTSVLNQKHLMSFHNPYLTKTSIV